MPRVPVVDVGAGVGQGSLMRACIAGTLAAMLTACGDSPPAPPVPVKLGFLVSPAGATAGAAISPAITVAIQDDAGNTVTSATTNVTLAIATNPGNGTLAGTTTVAAINGIATFSNVSIDKAGTGYTLSATTSGLAATASSAFNVVPGAPAKLAFVVQPSNVEGTQAIAPALQVVIRDAFDNTVTTATDAVTLALGSGAENPVGGTLYGTTTVNAVNGIATFSNVRVDRPSNAYVLRASAGTLPPAPSSPFAVRLTFASVEADTTHTCGATIHGAAYCWGKQGSGLGDGATQQSSAPILVTRDLTFALVSTGSGHTCGLTTAGKAYCWGAGGNNQIGDGGNSARSTPTAVSGGLTFTTLSAGWYHNCAVGSDGPSYCWGYNASAQLGDGTTTDRSSPVSPSGGLTFARIAGGRYHTCAVTPAGAAYCWGSNNNGEVGDGTAVIRTSPTLVAGGLTFTSIATGGGATSGHSCGITTSGSAYCWGNNSSGQLGDGSTTNRNQPTAVTGGLAFNAISVGSNHTCALTAGGIAYCWGSNASGQLGDGTTVRHSDPRPVLSPAGVTFTFITAGDSHSCAVGSSGVAYCWGLNADGQLGVGDLLARTSPTPAIP